jgi:hypothetical protein
MMLVLLVHFVNTRIGFTKIPRFAFEVLAHGHHSAGRLTLPASVVQNTFAEISGGVIGRVPKIGCIAEADLLRQWHVGFPL